MRLSGLEAVRWALEPLFGMLGIDSFKRYSAVMESTTFPRSSDRSKELALFGLQREGVLTESSDP